MYLEGGGRALLDGRGAVRQLNVDLQLLYSVIRICTRCQSYRIGYLRTDGNDRDPTCHMRSHERFQVLNGKHPSHLTSFLPNVNNPLRDKSFRPWPSILNDSSIMTFCRGDVKRQASRGITLKIRFPPSLKNLRRSSYGGIDISRQPTIRGLKTPLTTVSPSGPQCDVRGAGAMMDGFTQIAVG